MKLIAKIKLQPTDTQRPALHATLQRVNAACNAISAIAWEAHTFNKYGLQQLCYYAIREEYGLSSQMMIRALGKVAVSYQKNRQQRHQFRKHGAFPYDERLLKYNVVEQRVSIRTLSGREEMGFVAGKAQLALLEHQKGQSDLAFVRGEFYLYATCEIETPEALTVSDYLEVDLGIVNLATTDDGKRYSGRRMNRTRHRYQRLRGKLQQKGTKPAKRLLKKRSGQESRFVNDVNHCISKAIVEKAKRTGRGIALEDLTHIRDRVRLRKPQRTRLHSWRFADLGEKLTYKAKRAGLPVVPIDPAYTSQTCSQCGHRDKQNRPNQSTFECTACGFSAHADVNAAINIGRWASVSRPDADTLSG